MAPKVCRRRGDALIIKTKVKTSVTKDDMTRFRKAIEKAKGAYVTIGVHDGAGQYQDGTQVVQVALWNEFGTSKIPERSFFRTAIDENEGKINAWREEALMKITDGTWTVHKALEALGFRIQVLIQNKIKSNVPPPNAKSTTDAKIRDGYAPQTLIASGLMLRSVTFRVYGT